jgi:hypothetical protein
MADTHLLEDASAPGIPGVIEVEADSSGLQAFNRSRAATETMQQPDTISADRGLRSDAQHSQHDARDQGLWSAFSTHVYTPAAGHELLHTWN